MNILNLRQFLSDAEVRIEKCIPLFGAICSDSMSTDLANFLEEVDHETFVSLFPSFVCTESDHEDFQVECVERGHLGFLVEIATPVMKPSGAGRRVFSWSSYYKRWIYAPTIDGVVQKALDWAAERRAAETRKGIGA